MFHYDCVMCVHCMWLFMHCMLCPINKMAEEIVINKLM
jgi:hypothetical protein